MNLLKKIMMLSMLLGSIACYAMTQSEIAFKLANAVDNQDINTMKDILNNNPGIAKYKDSQGNSPWFSGWTPETIQTMIDFGADVNLKNLTGNTLLYARANKPDSASVKTLLDAKADITITNLSGDTPLKVLLNRIRQQNLQGSSYFNSPDVLDQITKVIELLTQHKKFDFKTFNASLENEIDRTELLTIFIKHALLEDIMGDKPINYKLLKEVYNLLKNEEWFQQLPSFAVFQALGDVIPNQRLEQKDAVFFLKNINTIADPKATLKLDNKKIEVFANAYRFAKKHNLKKLGSMFLRHMEALAKIPQDIGGIIASFQNIE